VKSRITTAATTAINSDSKKTIDYRQNFAQTRNSQTFLICQSIAFRITATKFNCKFCLENPNKSKSETVEHFKLRRFKIHTIYRTIKRFEKQEIVERKIGSGKKCALSSSKVRAALKK
jgi:hypothetical protein